jgi:pSer/pThr/pTyr-binding forkhead associated (FHA) protein
MVQLKILSGNSAGTAWLSRRFPVRIGRATDDDLSLADPGVWEHHLRLELVPAQGFRLTVRPDALASVNGQAVQQAMLRNGDTMEIGGATLQFWLAEVRQAGFRWREWVTWAGIGLICLGQVFLVYLLLR